MIDGFHHAWLEREDELRLEAEKEAKIRGQLSQKLLQPVTDEARKDIARMAGIDVNQLHEELEQVRKERDLIRSQFEASKDTVARDKANNEANFMDQIVKALSQPPPPSAPLQSPPDCFCPITTEIMDDPVIIDAACNHTISRVAAQRWLESHSNCPLCHAPDDLAASY